MRRSKSSRNTELLREERRLRREIERTKGAIDTARNHFEQVVDPMLIDCYIYELNAAQLRYQFLLQNFKKREF
ncbi:MAG TPA: YaaL family protein [Candidatus Lachnoclostridium pullistercoris]|uniref:YaaL family protein n=1 Tax=Candidatus Lachnoclostridium pullistercoris TaxID=2838632 RepID=A0A9D2T7J5_9FIRM|nr:YaaL family protein [Candidatus Lachnoclostridium pullistercoris]